MEQPSRWQNYLKESYNESEQGFEFLKDLNNQHKMVYEKRAQRGSEAGVQHNRVSTNGSLVMCDVPHSTLSLGLPPSDTPAAEYLPCPPPAAKSAPHRRDCICMNTAVPCQPQSVITTIPSPMHSAGIWVNCYPAKTPIPALNHHQSH